MEVKRSGVGGSGDESDLSDSSVSVHDIFRSVKSVLVASKDYSKEKVSLDGEEEIWVL